jgi:hypothetical protein
VQKAIAGNLTPEEEELEKKKAELSLPEKELTQQERYLWSPDITQQK